MIETLSATQARALAALVHELRQDWDATGILTALHAARNRSTPAGVAIAAIRAASVASNRTPAMIALEGSHWRDAAPRADAPRCTVPGHEHELAHACRACVSDLHAGVDVADMPGISEDQAARNIAGAALVRAKYTRPAWLDTTEGKTP